MEVAVKVFHILTRLGNEPHSVLEDQTLMLQGGAGLLGSFLRKIKVREAVEEEALLPYRRRECSLGDMVVSLISGQALDIAELVVRTPGE